MATFDGFGTEVQLGDDLNQTSTGDIGNLGNGLNWYHFYTDIILGIDGAPTVAWVEPVNIDEDDDITWNGPYVASWDGSTWNLLGGGALESSLVNMSPPVIGSTAGTPPSFTDGDRFWPSRPQLVFDGTNVVIAYTVCEAATVSGEQWWPFNLVLKYWNGSSWTDIVEVAGTTWSSYFYNTGGGNGGNFSVVSLAGPFSGGHIFVSWAESGPTDPSDFTADYGCHWKVHSYALDGTLDFSLTIVDVSDPDGVGGTQPSVAPGFSAESGVQAAPNFHRFVVDDDETLYLAFASVADPTGSILPSALGFNLLSIDPDEGFFPITAPDTTFTAVSAVTQLNPAEADAEYFYPASDTRTSDFSGLDQTPSDGDDALTQIDGTPAQTFEFGPIVQVLPDQTNTEDVWVVVLESGDDVEAPDREEPDSTVGKAMQVCLYHRTCPTATIAPLEIDDWLSSGSDTRFKYPAALIDGDHIYVAAMMGDGGIRVFDVPIVRNANECASYPVFNNHMRIGENPDLLRRLGLRR